MSVHDKGSDPDQSFAGLAPREPNHPMTVARPRSEVAVDPDVLRQMEFDQEEAFPLRRYLHLLMGRRWQIFSVTAVIVLIALIQAFTTTPLFRSEATLQIDPETPSILGNEQAGDLSFSPKGMEEYLATQTRKLETRNLARRVIAQLDLGSQAIFTEPASRGFFVERVKGTVSFVRGLFGGDEAPLDDRVLVDRFLENLSVQALRNTHLVQVSFTHRDPELAARIVDTLIEEFIEQTLESRFEATTKVTDFLSGQLNDFKTSVEGSEGSLIDYARANDIVSLNERETIDAQKLADLTDEMTRVESELIQQRTRYEAVKKATADRFPQILLNPTISRLEAELSTRRQELAGMSSRYGPEWPSVKELRQQIDELDVQIRHEKRVALDAARQRYEMALDRYQRLSTAAEEQRKVVDQLNNDSIQYNILRREVDTNKELYEGLLQQLKEAGISGGLSWSNIRLADSAEVPRRPSYPRRSLALVVALALGLFLGVAWALLAEAMDDTFGSTEEVSQALRLPALGVIPIIDGLGGNAEQRSASLRKTDLREDSEHTASKRKSGGRKAGGRKSNHRKSGGRPSSERSSVERRSSDRGSEEVLGSIVAYEGQNDFNDPSWEAYRSLRTSLLLSHSGKPPQTILVTSALPGEGKSTTVANTAIVLAQTGARTLILDLDMRRPTMDKIFGMRGQEGMSTFLSGNSDLSSQVQQTRFPNLYLVPAGPPAPNPAELVGAQRMRSGLEVLQQHFDHIIIDSPPCLEITDALVLATQVDGLLLVVRAGKTPKALVRKATDRVLRVGGKILGVLVNAVDLRRSEYGYYHSYYRSYYRSYYGETGDARVRKSA